MPFDMVPVLIDFGFIAVGNPGEQSYFFWVEPVKDCNVFFSGAHAKVRLGVNDFDDKFAGAHS